MLDIDVLKISRSKVLASGFELHLRNVGLAYVTITSQ